MFAGPNKPARHNGTTASAGKFHSAEILRHSAVSSPIRKSGGRWGRGVKHQPLLCNRSPVTEAPTRRY
ncbi:MAG: hypothetical protein ABSH12_09980 [Endomicrobiales bacterium]